MGDSRFRVLAEGLRFPEGPALLADGSLALVEVERGTLMRITPAGALEEIAFLGGGPNGAKVGPDGAIYVCNNGGFVFHEEPGMLRPIGTPDSYVGGSIQRVDIASGEVTTLYGGENNEWPQPVGDSGSPLLKGPNDLVFEKSGHFWFTDMGKTREGSIDRARVFYASADGKSIHVAINHMLGANGIGLSPDEKKLYVAETVTGRLWEFDIEGPGKVVPRPWPSPNGGGRLLYGSSTLQYFDSMAIEASGNICVGTLLNGGISVISPAGELVEHVATPDVYASNLCFSPDGRTAYITLSTTGRVVSTAWPRPGLPATY
jgi:gluconolactonase